MNQTALALIANEFISTGLMDWRRLFAISNGGVLLDEWHSESRADVLIAIAGMVFERRLVVEALVVCSSTVLDYLPPDVELVRTAWTASNAWIAGYAPEQYCEAIANELFQGGFSEKLSTERELAASESIECCLQSTFSWDWQMCAYASVKSTIDSHGLQGTRLTTPRSGIEIADMIRNVIPAPTQSNVLQAQLSRSRD